MSGLHLTKGILGMLYFKFNTFFFFSTFSEERPGFGLISKHSLLVLLLKSRGCVPLPSCTSHTIVPLLLLVPTRLPLMLQ